MARKNPAEAGLFFAGVANATEVAFVSS